MCGFFDGIFFKKYFLMLETFLSCLNLFTDAHSKTCPEFQLISHLNDIVIDQIPALGQLKEFLLRMQMQNFADQLSSQPIIEQLPEIRDRMESANSGKWASIAKYQVTHYFTPSENDLRKMASKLVFHFRSVCN